MFSFFEFIKNAFKRFTRSFFGERIASIGRVTGLRGSRVMVEVRNFNDGTNNVTLVVSSTRWTMMNNRHTCYLDLDTRAAEWLADNLNNAVAHTKNLTETSQQDD